MKTFVILALTFVFVFLLLRGAEAIDPYGPVLVVAAVCGALGAALAQLTYWLVGKYVLKKRSA